MNFRELLSREFPLSPSQLDQLEKHYHALLAWNQKMNLTRIKNVEDAVHFHYGEAIFLARSLPSGPLTIADVGSGGGLPGIPLAAVRPDCEITLIESNQRKAVFLCESARQLANTRVLPQRLGSVERRFDWAVSRAVRPGDVLASPISQNFALLISRRELAGLPPPVSTKTLPWGNERILAMFHVEHPTDVLESTERNSGEQSHRGNESKGRRR